jgi:predicted metal-binding membrane protein
MSGMDNGAFKHARLFHTLYRRVGANDGGDDAAEHRPNSLEALHGGGGLRTALQFVLSYLTVWALAGVIMFPLRRPLGSLVSGIIVIGAGMYEVTPFKQFFRRRCYGKDSSGFEFGLNCVGSCIALMTMQFALGVMSITWLAVMSIFVLAQKLLPPKAANDVSLALAIVVMGFLIVIAPYRYSFISQIQGRELLGD